MFYFTRIDGDSERNAVRSALASACLSNVVRGKLMTSQVVKLAPGPPTQHVDSREASGCILTIYYRLLAFLLNHVLDATTWCVVDDPSGGTIW